MAPGLAQSVAQSVALSVALAIALSVALVLVTPGAGAAQDWEGRWSGTLVLPGPASLILAFELVPDPDPATGRGWTATMDSPQQGATGIPVSRVEVEGDSIHLEVGMVGGRYQGERTGEDRIEGHWSQGGQSFGLELVRSGDRDGDGDGGAGEVPSRRPQDPEPPFPYSEAEVEVVHPEAGFTLAGTLTLPQGASPEAPVAGVVLVTGSGAQNRDQEIAGHRPFGVLADHLARAGVAVLRLDDRGVGGSGGSMAEATTAELATDAAAALAWLRGRPELQEDAVGVVGHSEGGVIAAHLAAGGVGERVGPAELSVPDFVVLLGTPALPGRQVLQRQGDLILAAGGVPPGARALNARIQGALLEAAADPASMSEGARAALDSIMADADPTHLEALGLPEDPGVRAAFLDQQVEAVFTPWMRYFIAHDPTGDLGQVEVPVLALFGTLDLQVPWEENLAAMAAALGVTDADPTGDLPRTSGEGDVVLQALDGLNHLFQTAVTGHPAEYASLDETFSPVALEAITAWMRHRGLAPQD